MVRTRKGADPFALTGAIIPPKGHLSSLQGMSSGIPRPMNDPVRPSWRKPAGIAIILLLILLLAGLVASLSPAVGKWPVLVQALFYLFMGIVWIMPLKPLIRWMETGRFRAPAKLD